MLPLYIKEEFVATYRNGWRNEGPNPIPEAGDIGGARTKAGIAALTADPLFRAAMADVLVQDGWVSYVPAQPFIDVPGERYLTLGDLINRLEKENPEKVIALGFGSPHSYRGAYENLAFEPVRRCRVGDMLNAAESALGATFTGYKGGEYVMSTDTEVFICFSGEDTDNQLGPLLLEFLLAQDMFPNHDVPPHTYRGFNRFNQNCHYPGCSTPTGQHSGMPKLPEGSDETPF